MLVIAGNLPKTVSTLLVDVSAEIFFEPFLEEDQKLSHDHRQVPRPHRPALLCFGHCQRERFERGTLHLEDAFTRHGPRNLFGPVLITDLHAEGIDEERAPQPISSDQYFSIGYITAWDGP